MPTQAATRCLGGGRLGRSGLGTGRFPARVIRRTTMAAVLLRSGATREISAMIAVREHVGGFDYTREREAVAVARVPAVARVASVDVVRGLAVVAMLAANLVNVFLRDIPAVLAHNQG